MPDPANKPRARYIGLVDAQGVGFGKAREDPHYTASVFLCAWRVDGGALERGCLRAHQSPPQATFNAMTKIFTPDSIVVFVGQPAVATFGVPVIQTDRFELGEMDAEFAAEAARLRVPVTHTDPVFGELVLNRLTKDFEGRSTWLGVPISVSFYVAAVETLGPLLSTARRVWLDQERWDRELRSRLAELLPLKNEGWLDEGEPEIGLAEFLRRIIPSSFSVNEEAGFSLCFNDGDLFWGHDISISGTLEGGLGEAGLIG